jgi:DNA invertase Pin-like site-specific DNA recombinase
MKKAYSYQRFSSIKQSAGDSIRRQTHDAQVFCKQFSLQLVSTFKDEGVSGFKGRNFSNESALGHFLKLVENGTIEKGSVLVIENMDRLSRQSILPCLGCHRAEQNRPEMSDSKPATLKVGIHIISGFSIKGFSLRVKTSRTG